LLLCVSEEKYDPDYFTVKDENNTLCLATGFSRHNATLNGPYGEEFNKTKSVRISKDSLYNQVIFLEGRNATCDSEYSVYHMNEVVPTLIRVKHQRLDWTCCGV